MGKTRKSLKIFRVLAIVLLIVSLVYINTHQINGYITNKDIAYTPKTLAIKSHKDIISIDTFEYWIFKLNRNQKEKIEEELESDKWSNIRRSVHSDILNNFIYEEPWLEEIIYSGNCYICVYDDYNAGIITLSNKFVYDKLTQAIIFLYEPESGYYMCFHYTM